MENILIVSLKFSPGLYQHMIAYAKAFDFLGFCPILFLNKDYKIIAEEDGFLHLYDAKSANKRTYKLALFINIYPQHVIMSKKLKKAGTSILYLYHEPWDSLANYLKEGVVQAVKGVAANLLTLSMLRDISQVILSSKYSLNLYVRRFIKINKNFVLIPLLYDDLAGENIESEEKKYFSYIGHAVKGHNFDLYIKLMKFISEVDESIKFCIATRNDLTGTIKKDKKIKQLIEEGRVEIIHGRPLSEPQINESYKKSFCIFNIYRRSTQSGVLPKAFMFGTPVIANNIGSFPEFIKNGKNGFLIDEFDKTNIYEKIIFIKNNLNVFTKEARNTFLETFYWRNNVNIKKINQLVC